MNLNNHTPRYCEHCGGDKPWARPDWFLRDGIGFCSEYCAGNNDGYLKRMIFNKRFRGSNREAYTVLWRCYSDKKRKTHADIRPYIYQDGKAVLYVPPLPVPSYAVTPGVFATT